MTKMTKEIKHFPRLKQFLQARQKEASGFFGNFRRKVCIEHLEVWMPGPATYLSMISIPKNERIVNLKQSCGLRQMIAVGWDAISCFCIRLPGGKNSRISEINFLQSNGAGVYSHISFYRKQRNVIFLKVYTDSKCPAPPPPPPPINYSQDCECNFAHW